jgi:hypothetical protein
MRILAFGGRLAVLNNQRFWRIRAPRFLDSAARQIPVFKTVLDCFVPKRGQFDGF